MTPESQHILLFEGSNHVSATASFIDGAIIGETRDKVVDLVLKLAAEQGHTFLVFFDVSREAIYLDGEKLADCRIPVNRSR